MKLLRITAIALLAATLSLFAFAQPGPGDGSVSGPGAGMRGGMGGGYGGGMGGGPRGGGMGGGYRFNNANTPGWTLMTEVERNDFRQKMWNSKTYDECKVTQTEHRTLMDERATSKNVTLPQPRYNACDRMKARGIIK